MTSPLAHPLAARRLRWYRLGVSGIWVQWLLMSSLAAWFRHGNGVLTALCLCCVALELRFALRIWRHRDRGRV